MTAASAPIFPPLVVEAAEEGGVRRSQRLAAHKDTPQQQMQAHAELQQCGLELEQCRAELDLCRTELRLKTLGKRTGRQDLLSTLLTTWEYKFKKGNFGTSQSGGSVSTT